MFFLFFDLFRTIISRLFKILICFFESFLKTPFSFFVFFRKFFSKDSKESPFNILKCRNRVDVKKSQRVPSFTVSGIVTCFKRNNFRVKIRFSQARHAISDFCCFKRPVFFLCDFFKNLFHRNPSSIFARSEMFCES